MSSYAIKIDGSDYASVDYRSYFRAIIPNAPPLVFQVSTTNYSPNYNPPPGNGQVKEQLNQFLINAFPGYNGPFFTENVTGNSTSTTPYLQVKFHWSNRFRLESFNDGQWYISESDFAHPHVGVPELRYDDGTDQFYVIGVGSQYASTPQPVYMRSRDANSGSWTEWFTVYDNAQAANYAAGNPGVIRLKNRPLPGRIYQTSFVPLT